MVSTFLLPIVVAANLIANGDFTAPLSGTWHGGPYGGGPGKLEVAKDPDGTSFARLYKEKGPGATQILGLGGEIGEGAVRLKVSFRHRGGKGIFNLGYFGTEGGKPVAIKNQVGGNTGHSESLKATPEWTEYERIFRIPASARDPKTRPRAQFSTCGGTFEVTGVVYEAMPEEVKELPPPLSVKVVHRPKRVPYAPVEPVDRCDCELRDGLLYRDGKACFWVGNGCELGSSQSSPAGLWLAKLLGYQAMSIDPAGSLAPRLEGTNLTLTGTASLAGVTWARESMRLGFFTDFFGNGVYKWSPLRKIAEAHPDFKEVHYDHGHYLNTDAGHPLGRAMQREKRAAYFELVDKARAPGVVELCREPAPLPENRRAKEGFREWAKRKYGDLGTANRVWRRSFRSWDEVVPLHLLESDVSGYAARLAQVRAMRNDYPELCWDWIAYNQDDATAIVSNAFEDLRQDVPGLFRTIDIRGHTHQELGYASLDPERIAPLEDFHYIHFGNQAYAYNESPYSAATLFNQTWFSLFYHSFAKNVTDRPVINSEDIISRAQVPASNDEAMRANDIGALCGPGWRFRFETRAGEGLEGKWFARDLDDSRWDETSVPGCWDDDARYAGRAGAGWYRRRFVARAARLDWEDGSHRFYLYGADLAKSGRVWLNGHELGEVAPGGGKFRFEVSSLLNYGGENELVFRIEGDGYRSGVKGAVHVLANDRIGESRPFGEQNYRFMLWPYMMRGVSGCWVWSWHQDYLRPYFPGLVRRLETAAEVVLPAVRHRAGEVAFLYGYLNGRGLPCPREDDHVDTMTWFDALEFSGLTADAMGERTFVGKVTPERYPLVVVPHVRMVKDETWAHFRRYIEAGGKAIVTDDSFAITFSRYAPTDFAGFAAAHPDRIVVVRGRPTMEELMTRLGPQLPAPTVKVEELDAKTDGPREPALVQRVLAGNADRKVLYLANWGGMRHRLRVTLPAALGDWRLKLIEGPETDWTRAGRTLTLTLPSQDLVAFMLERPDAELPPLELEADPVTAARLARLVALNAERPDHAGPKALFTRLGEDRGQAMDKVLYPYLLDRLDAFGCAVESSDPAEWTAERLKGYALVVISETNTAQFFRDRKKMDAFGRLLADYVRGGGSLLVMAYTGCSPNLYALTLTGYGRFSPHFGVDLGEGAYDEAHAGFGDPSQVLTDVIAPGPLTEGVRRVQLGYVRPIVAAAKGEVRPVTVVGLPGRDAAVGAMSALELGKGRAFFCADVMAFQPYRIGEADNAALLENLVGWLLRRPVTGEMREEFRRGLFLE